MDQFTAKIQQALEEENLSRYFFLVPEEDSVQVMFNAKNNPAVLFEDAAYFISSAANLLHEKFGAQVKLVAREVWGRIIVPRPSQSNP